jgi:hypothetical protein
VRVVSWLSVVAHKVDGFARLIADHLAADMRIGPGAHRPVITLNRDNEVTGRAVIISFLHRPNSLEGTPRQMSSPLKPLLIHGDAYVVAAALSSERDGAHRCYGSTSPAPTVRPPAPKPPCFLALPMSSRLTNIQDPKRGTGPHKHSGSLKDHRFVMIPHPMLSLTCLLWMRLQTRAWCWGSRLRSQSACRLAHRTLPHGTPR